jgi:hypothetical protein
LKFGYKPLFSLSSVVDLISEVCLTKSEKLSVALFPNLNVGEVSVVVDEIGVEN